MAGEGGTRSEWNLEKKWVRQPANQSQPADIQPTYRHSPALASFGSAGQTQENLTVPLTKPGCSVSGYDGKLWVFQIRYLSVNSSSCFSWWEVYDVSAQSITSVYWAVRLFATHNGVDSLIYFTMLNTTQYNSIRQLYLLHWGTPPAHFEDGAAGLYDGHQDQGGDTGNYHVELHIGVNLSWLAPLITVVWGDWNDKYFSLGWENIYNLPTLSKERDSASTWRCSILPPLTVSFRASSTVNGSGSASNWFLSTMTTRVESNSPWPPL